MDNKSVENASSAFLKIQELVDNEELVIFSKDEAQALKEVSKLWTQAKALVALGGVLGRGIKWLLFMVTTWAIFKAGLLEWIKSSLK